MLAINLKNIISTVFILQIIHSISGDTIIYDINAYYFDAAPDGVTKQVLGVNGQFPGPTIRAKLGDTLVVRVTNSIRDKDGVTYSTSVHWHGIEMFLTPFYDGSEGVAQCPIPYGQSMEYRFKLYQSGTYWYHSHHSWQYTDGFWGLLIIDNIPEIYTYDDELAFSIQDWYHKPSKIIADQFHRQEIIRPGLDTGLINGRGTYPCDKAIGNGFECDPNLQFPIVHNVKPGKTYRIRVVSTSAYEVFDFAIDGHKLTVIEVDGVDTVKVGPVDSVSIQPAQRYSFLVTMNGTLDSYWIRSSTTFIQKYEAKAILQYNQNLTMPSIHPPLNSKSGTQGRPEKHEINWKQLVKDAKEGNAKSPLFNMDTSKDYVFPAVKFPSVHDSLPKNEHNKLGLTTSNIELPITEPIVNPIYLNPNLCRPYDSRGSSSAPNYYDELVILNATLETDFSSFVHFKMNGLVYQAHSPPVVIRMIKNIEINSTSIPQYTPLMKRVVQIVVNNDDFATHPWHLHGHTFWVLGTGVAGSGPYNESRDKDKLNVDGVRRDTTQVDGKSWLVVRFETDNPGAWAFHCHINWHPEVGLAAVFVEGEEELRTLYTIPEEAKRMCALNGIQI